MKRLLSILCIVCLMMAGCAEQKEEEGVPFSVSGTFQYYIQAEDGYVITISNEDGLVEVLFNVTIPGIEEMTPGYELTLSGTMYESSGFRIGNAMSVDSVPLEVELGCDGYDLMCQAYDYNYSSILTQASYSYSVTSNGRSHTYTLNNSYYLDQDENAAYHNVVRKSSDDFYTTSSSTMRYVDRFTGEEYTLFNYGSWEYSEGADTSTVSMSMNRNDIEVTEFILEGDRVAVSGVCKSVSEDSHLAYILNDVLSETPEVLDKLVISFIAKFDRSSHIVKYVEYTAELTDPVDTGKGSVNVNQLTITVSGINFNNDDSVIIPDYAKYPADLLIPIPMEEGVRIPLCESLLGVDVDMITPEYVTGILGDPYSNEHIISVCNPDDVVLAAMDILTNSVIEEFMNMIDSDELTVEQRIAVDSIAAHLQDGAE